MSLPKVNPTKTDTWKALEKHFREMEMLQMQDVFLKDPDRADDFKIEWQDFYLDYSKNRITDETLLLLLKLAEEINLKEAIVQQFSGERINETE
ncbi:MAG TPA: glucose-6-phosphate isomerase, partial [Aequorivita sp.]|nr:glucose-6-phosphate isomerase [Aequorivita sp.]